jgi:two-component system, chemotaxis family, response regulator Rcp1
MHKRIQVLLVEDNPADADLTREGFATSDLPIDLTVTDNGIEAIDYIRKRGQYEDAPTPDLILLDLNLPGIDGRTVLNEIKQDSQLRCIPVSILTSSTTERDVDQSYRLGANCYVVKPLDFVSFRHILQAFEDFWFATAKLPGVHGEEDA